MTIVKILDQKSVHFNENSLKLLKNCRVSNQNEIQVENRDHFKLKK